MSLAKINNFANDDTDILAVQSTVDALYNNSYSLTNYDNTTVPAIAAGSKIEVNGSLYRAATDEAISTTDPVTSSTVAYGTVYICMIPSGDASTCTAAFTATAPTWSDSKQGWYGTGDYANYKYLKFAMNKNSTSYSYKNDYLNIISRKKNHTIANRTSNQSIATGGYTKLEINNEIIDIFDGYDSSANYRYTAPRDQTIEISIKHTVVTNYARTVYLYKNGSGFFAFSDNAHSYQSVFHTMKTDVLADDYIEFYLYNNSGNSISITPTIIIREI